MIQQSITQSQDEWIRFIEMIKDTKPVEAQCVMQYVKLKCNVFPSDETMIQYYESVFSKTTNSSNRKKWHEMDKNLLIWCMVKSLNLQGRDILIPNHTDWENISKILNVAKQLVELKWISLLHSNLRITAWTKEEDRILTNLANQFYQKNNWTELTLRFNAQSQTQRYPKQIRERWNNVLNPNIEKSMWKEDEKMKLLSLVMKYGKKWSIIQNQLTGRTENQIKNQYSAIFRNVKKNSVQEKEEFDLIKEFIQNCQDKMMSLSNQQTSTFLVDKINKKYKVEDLGQKDTSLLQSNTISLEQKCRSTFDSQIQDQQIHQNANGSNSSLFTLLHQLQNTQPQFISPLFSHLFNNSQQSNWLDGNFNTGMINQYYNYPIQNIPAFNGQSLFSNNIQNFYYCQSKSYEMI